MYILLFIFFGSLLGIAFMLGRKLALLESGEIRVEENMDAVHYFEELKRSLLRNMRMTGFALLVGLVRLYVKVSEFLHSEYRDTKEKLAAIYEKNVGAQPRETLEASGFMKKIGEYKRRLRRIKQKVKQEKKK